MEAKKLIRTDRDGWVNGIKHGVEYGGTRRVPKALIGGLVSEGETASSYEPKRYRKGKGKK